MSDQSTPINGLLTIEISQQRLTLTHERRRIMTDPGPGLGAVISHTTSEATAPMTASVIERPSGPGVKGPLKPGMLVALMKQADSLEMMEVLSRGVLRRYAEDRWEGRSPSRRTRRLAYRAILRAWDKTDTRRELRCLWLGFWSADLPDASHHTEGALGNPFNDECWQVRSGSYGSWFQANVHRPLASLLRPEADLAEAGLP